MVRLTTALQIVFIFLFAVFIQTDGFSLTSEIVNILQQDTVPKQSASPKQPVYTTSRLVGAKPVIDGKLDDECWTKGTWAGNFRQWIPKKGAKPSYPTYFNIQYDDRNLYVAIRSYDGEPRKMLRQAGVRDEFSGDMAGVNFDSYHDYRTGFEFTVTSWGQRIALV